ncbi:MAG TPA: glycosyltransferase family 4 protein [Caulobacteraceae bacterium]|jgi:UDP-glucose:(heptosyl)LPS alpha-1,3-glucosyltransferase|nr:glycosyltransferase family 4 protein [Caulobacteraceae bacterium]
MTGSSPPRIALAVHHLAPAGGLEQHALRLAAILARRGAAVTMITTRASADPPAGIRIERISPRGHTNHGRLAAFAEDAARAAAGRFDRTVAFHAIPGFDAIFCADPSRAAPRGRRRWLPRHRAYADLERRALASGDGPVLLLSSAQLEAFAANHPAARSRLRLLAPTVDRLKAQPAAATAAARSDARQSLGLEPDAAVWLWMGLQPKTKGLDRTLRALAATPTARLVVCGLEQTSRAARPPLVLARRLGVADRVLWLGFASEAALAEAMAAADLLLHPSRADVTGTVILEALASGLPVITTAICGYGEHVAEADAGVVLPEPFDPGALHQALAAAAPETLARWSANALAYAGRDALYSGLGQAAELILSR